MYPNPSSDKISLDKVTKENTELQVYDIYGKVVLKQIVGPTTKTIEISQLPTGTYIIFSGSQQRGKFIKR